MLQRLLGLLALGILAVSQEPTGTIRTVTTDPWGGEVTPGGRLAILDTGGRKIREIDANGEASAIPYGEYVIAGAGLPVVRRVVVLNSPRLLVRMGLGLTWGDRVAPGGDNTLRVRLIPAPTDARKWWVLAVGVFHGDRREQTESQDGVFVIRGLHLGQYVVSVFSDRELRGHAEVSLRLDKSMTDEVEIAVRGDDPGVLRLRRP